MGYLRNGQKVTLSPSKAANCIGKPRTQTAQQVRALQQLSLHCPFTLLAVKPCDLSMNELYCSEAPCHLGRSVQASAVNAFEGRLRSEGVVYEGSKVLSV